MSYYTGLGAPGPASNPACGGTSPCTDSDYLWISDSCLSFLTCADPSNPLVIGANQGALPMVGAAIGQEAGSTVAAAAGGVLTGASQGLQQTGQGLGLSTTNMILLAAIAGLVVVATLLKR
jgi:hypothetical protein